VFGSCKKLKMSTRKKRTTTSSTRGASSFINDELNPSTLLTQGEELPEPSAATAKATYEAELAKLCKEAEEPAKAKKRFLAVQHEAEAAKEIQRQKADCQVARRSVCHKSKAISEFQSALAQVYCTQPIYFHRTQRVFHPAPSAHHLQP
jgi:hypothetical protein